MMDHCSDWGTARHGLGPHPISRRDSPMSNIEELKSTGLKATLPRLKILEIFQIGKQRHMTAEDVYRVLLEDRSDIGLATVYRVLTQFEQAIKMQNGNRKEIKQLFPYRKASLTNYWSIRIASNMLELPLIK